jgi:glutamate---cysteine ligase / carboxylate-amine ligase
LPVAPSWRIAENRWSAYRHGCAGTIADLQTGRRRPIRDCLHELIECLGPSAAALDSSALLAGATRLVERDGAVRQREVERSGGVRSVAMWLTERFLQPPGG